MKVCAVWNEDHSVAIHPPPPYCLLPAQLTNDQNSSNICRGSLLSHDVTKLCSALIWWWWYSGIFVTAQKSVFPFFTAGLFFFFFLFLRPTPHTPTGRHDGTKELHSISSTLQQAVILFVLLLLFFSNIATHASLFAFGSAVFGLRTHDMKYECMNLSVKSLNVADAHQVCQGFLD